MPCSALSPLPARAPNTTASDAVCATRTTTGSPLASCSSRSITPPRLRVTPSLPSFLGSLNGLAGLTCTRSSTLARPPLWPGSAVGAAQQVHVHQQRSRPDDPHQLARPAA